MTDALREADLLDVAAAVGGFTRDAANAAMEECRADGRLTPRPWGTANVGGEPFQSGRRTWHS